MGLKDKLKNLLDRKSGVETNDSKLEESESEHNEAEFLLLAEDIKNQIFDELVNQELEVDSNVEPVLVSEYDVGEVDIEQLSVDESIMTNHTEMNVIEHKSLDEIIEHLEGAEIIGDLPEEVSL
ncbi:MAG: hypothetical protein VXW70_06165 [Candidatus Thermoplasmatota archaeon]|nr:hypothetical protein [Candidatus Thermoplasmatota archaeon]MEC7255573.1 hypothetical protein [Candidatus Thermoplasmatota archaeon]MEC8243136.1 hypothetical protein [Candidatus Thermoplasmatota archaeon]MEC8257667.1 hypothetical protein [Candidatus Thermoplasmatota archaeon]MEC8312700.1 hypothetical protein [Candidatus Thermoplasmatota archaeon]